LIKDPLEEHNLANQKIYKEIINQFHLQCDKKINTLLTNRVK
jgi:hypothetical protein